jgi:hypothetical protein
MLRPSRGHNRMICKHKKDSARAAKRAELWLAADTHGEDYRCGLALL